MDTYLRALKNKCFSFHLAQSKRNRTSLVSKYAYDNIGTSHRLTRKIDRHVIRCKLTEHVRCSNSPKTVESKTEYCVVINNLFSSVCTTIHHHDVRVSTRKAKFVFDVSEQLTLYGIIILLSTIRDVCFSIIGLRSAGKVVCRILSCEHCI